jgi:hypothetical protein
MPPMLSTRSLAYIAADSYQHAYSAGRCRKEVDYLGSRNFSLGALRSEICGYAASQEFYRPCVALPSLLTSKIHVIALARRRHRLRKCDSSCYLFRNIFPPHIPSAKSNSPAVKFKLHPGFSRTLLWLSVWFMERPFTGGDQPERLARRPTRWKELRGGRAALKPGLILHIYRQGQALYTCLPMSQRPALYKADLMNP